MIDLSSDTATRPTDDMRRFMAAAPVGDDQRGEDPTVNELQNTAATLLGKEAALFLPSATMANQIAIRTLTEPGDEVICHETAHIRLYEGGGPALLSGCLLAPLPGERGGFTPDQVRETLRPSGPHFARTRLVCVENTHNYSGGCVRSPAEIDALAAVTREHGLAFHLDGARLLNAATALRRPPAELVDPFDTVTLCLSKGLGAPVGALLLGSREIIDRARRWKHVFGGAMRQAGIIAAGGLYALCHHVDRLAEDHDNARRLADGLATIPGVRLDPYPETNIVYFDIRDTGLTGEEARGRLEAAGVRASGIAHYRLRFVTHLDVTQDEIHQAIAIAQTVLRARPVVS
ncbi:MAG: GntG family PLP-dependent aldolase [Capsulimonadales bacterium]|nr:GntG family PLP-dependent aldolase [Capsulimonadales bacterium]